MSINAQNDEPAAPYLEFTLGDRMARALRHADLGVAEMAGILGVGRETVGRWMHGHNPPKRAALLAWAAITNVSIEWLETGKTPNDATDRYRITATQPAPWAGPAIVLAFRQDGVRASLTANRRTEPGRTRHLRSVS